MRYAPPGTQAFHGRGFNADGLGSNCRIHRRTFCRTRNRQQSVKARKSRELFRPDSWRLRIFAQADTAGQFPCKYRDTAALREWTWSLS